jgi:hypothetical protein
MSVGFSMMELVDLGMFLGTFFGSIEPLLTDGFTCLGGSYFLIIFAESILWIFSLETYCFASRLLFC